MSSTPTSRSDDLRRLRDEGYHLEVRSDPVYLVIRDVPYVNEQREVKFGVLVSTLTLDGDVTVRPDTHVVSFAGEVPCDQHGTSLGPDLVASTSHRVLAEGLEVDFDFSHKPPDGYVDYHSKMTTYVEMLGMHAQAIDPNVTAKTFPVVIDPDPKSPYRYLDTATSRVGIGEATDKLRGWKIGILGLGGTGGYVLDPMAKTPVAELHLFDGDRMHQHSAFRAPGAVPRAKLNMLKVDYLGEIYDEIHTGIVRHPYVVSESNVAQLCELDFVFICVDDADTRRLVVEHLEAAGVPFIDVGMGISIEHGSLTGILRTTTSTAENRDTARASLPLHNAAVNNDYVHNIQVADLNMLNAALAVARWKRFVGFYADFESEHDSSYVIDGNRLLNEGGVDGD